MLIIRELVVPQIMDFVMRVASVAVLILFSGLLLGTTYGPLFAPPVPWPPRPENIVQVGETYIITNTPTDVFTVPLDKFFVCTFVQGDLLSNDEKPWMMFYGDGEAQVSLLPVHFGQEEPNNLEGPIDFQAEVVGIPVPPGETIQIKQLTNNPVTLDFVLVGYLVPIM